MDLCLSDNALAREIIRCYFEKEITDRAGNGAVPIFCPSHGLQIIVNRDNEVNMAWAHAADVFLAKGC